MTRPCTVLAATVQFGRARAGKAAAEAAAEDLLVDFLACLRRNGQVGTGWTLSRFAGGFAASVGVPCAGAWLARHDAPAGRAARAAVTAAFGAPRWRLLGRAPAGATADWRAARRLLVFATAFETDTPVRDFETGAPIPVFLLPVAPELRQFLVAWAHDYALHDELWLASGPLELASYRQLASVQARPVADARALARQLERATRRPTYAYVLRHHALARGETTRPCPGCGRPWARRPHGARAFTFRCDPCRLVSHAGGDTGAVAALAAIGAWRRR